MAEAEHSLFSASGAEGWGPCPGKPAMEDGRRTSSQYADEGTAAHTLASWVLDARVAGRTRTAADFIGTKITVPSRDGAKPRVFTVDSTMAEHVDDYVDRFMLASDAETAERMVEQRVYYNTYLGVDRKLAFGTSDGVAILFDQPELAWENDEGHVVFFPPGDELQVHDLKYGQGVQVDADTIQLKLYGAGTLHAWDHVANFTRVRLVIHQPRKDHFSEIVITPAQMLAEVAKLKPSVPRVLAAWAVAKAMREKERSDLEVGEELHLGGFLKVTEKGCRFCDAKAVCPPKIAEVAEYPSGGRQNVTAADFEDLTLDTVEEVREYGGNYLAAAYARLDAIEDWSKAVRAEIDRRVLLKGEKFDGIKVVAGKKGKREWREVGEVELLAARLPAPIRELLYKRVLLTAPQAEKALRSSPMTWAKLQPMITQKDGKPAVVPASDKRPSFSHKAVVEEFEDLDATEQPAPRASAGRNPHAHPFR